MGKAWPLPATGYAIQASGGDPKVATPPDDVKDGPRIVADIGRPAAHIAPAAGGAPLSHVGGPSSKRELAVTDGESGATTEAESIARTEVESGAPLDVSGAEPPPSPAELAASGGVEAVPGDDEQARCSVAANATAGTTSVGIPLRLEAQRR